MRSWWARTKIQYFKDLLAQKYSRNKEGKSAAIRVMKERRSQEGKDAAKEAMASWSSKK